MKKIIIILLLIQNIYGSALKDSWTINLFTTNSIGQVDHYIKNNIKYPKQNIYIFKIKNKYTTKYIVTYGLFENYIASNKFLDKEKRNLKFVNPYIKKHKYNLHNPSLVPTLIKIIKYTNGSVIVDEVVIKTKIESESHNIKKEKKKKTKRFVDVNKYLYDISLEYSNNLLSGNMKTMLSDPQTDFKNDLGLTKSNNNIIPKILIQKNGHKIFFTYYSNSFNKTKTITKDIIVNNFTFAQGSSINSSIDLSFISIGYKIDINSYDVGIDYHTLENKVDIIGHSNSVKIDGTYSTMALSLDKKYVYNENVLFYGISIGQSSAMKYLEYKLEVEYNIYENIEIAAGYKVKEIQIDDNSYNADVNINSLYIKLLKRF